MLSKTHLKLAKQVLTASATTLKRLLKVCSDLFR
jgi:hypothetical protein